MESALKKLWYDAKTGFTSARDLYQALKPQFPQMTHKIVQNWVKQQFAQQVTARAGPPPEYSSIVSPALRTYYQMDLMIYDRFEFHNYKYILVVVDIYSRYAMARPLTNRTFPNLMKNIKDIFSIMGDPYIIQCDNEFNTKVFNDFCRRNDLVPKYSLPEEKNKNAIVERLNGTIASILQKWRVATGRHDWYKVLDQVMDNYNNRRHSTIKAKPIDVWEGRDSNHQVPKRVTYDIHPGDRVRLQRSKGVFDKGDALKYSREIFTVRKVDGIKVYLNEFADWVKPYQLMKVKEVEEHPEPEMEHEPVHKKIQIQRKLKKALNKEGVEENQVALRRSARERKPQNQADDVRYGNVFYS